jgi:hypothetical protein
MYDLKSAVAASLQFRLSVRLALAIIVMGVAGGAF